MAPRKMNKEPIWPFPFTRLQAKHIHSILKVIPGLEIATNTVANATNISSLVTKNSGLVAITFFCVDIQ